jgi:hypothetical protein
VRLPPGLPAPTERTGIANATSVLCIHGGANYSACLDDRACRRRNVAFKRSRLEVITRPEEFAGHRIEIAYDEHTGTEAAASTK